MGCHGDDRTVRGSDPAGSVTGRLRRITEARVFEDMNYAYAIVKIMLFITGVSTSCQHTHRMCLRERTGTLCLLHRTCSALPTTPIRLACHQGSADLLCTLHRAFRSRGATAYAAMVGYITSRLPPNIWEFECIQEPVIACMIGAADFSTVMCRTSRDSPTRT